MGIYFIDEYTLSHFIGGMIMQRLGLSRVISYSLAILYEMFENYIYALVAPHACIHVKYILPIPDCKTKADTIQNIVGDMFFYILGYEFAKMISTKHIPMLPKSFIYLIPIGPLLLSLISTNIIGKTPDYETL